MSELAHDAESRRLSVLRCVLDSAPEPAFDAIAARAARAAGAAYAFVALHDNNRLFFKASYGAERREAPAQEAMSMDALRAQGVTWIEDTTRHPRHCLHHWVVNAPFLRTYVGVPLRLSTGEAIGVLCAVGLAPRARDEAVVKEFEELATIAAALLEAQRNARLQQESERLLVSFIEGAPAALAMFDRDMRYLHASPRWRSDYGLEGAEIIGRSHYEVFPEIGEDWKAIHRRCLAGATERCVRDKFVRADGREQWLTWEVRPWRDAAGRIGGIVMLTLDMTREVDALLQLERTAARLGRALEIGRAYMWEFDSRDGRVFIDGDSEKVLGVPMVVTENPYDGFSMLHPEDQPVAVARWDALMRGTPSVGEHRVVTPTGKLRWIRSLGEAKLDENGAVVGAVGLIQDVTDRKEAELQAEAARDIAERASRSKSELLTTISHEMRTPLNGVLGLAHALARAPLDPEQRKLVDGVIRSGDTLLELVNDLLDSARIEAGQLSLAEEPFELSELLGDIGALYKERALAKGLTFSVSGAGLLGRWRGDALRIKQVLLNLIGNAVKFTLKGGVHLDVSRRPSGPNLDTLVFTVRDTGIGFDEETRARLFKRFAQADPDTARRFGGTGLGLSICRGLVELMGGQIDCRSTPGVGSEFWFSAPFQRASQPAAPEAAPSTETEPQRQLRVLCVDDHPVNREVLARTLAHFGCAAAFAENGAEAVEAWEKDSGFDIILMDLLMPVMSGEDAARAIRAREAATGRPRTPIIAVSAHAGSLHAAACRAAGMDGHIAKPFKPALLAAAMREAIGAT
ncbi:MAG: PAS domain-containing protein [Hyphomonadaceae bacterium]|nr:PAS domain-containing protein [Hyphomonadaceae bacterium]